MTLPPRNTTVLSLLAASLLVGLVLTGCRRSQGPFPVWAYSADGDYLPAPGGGGLVVDPKSEIPDVPRPVGFVAVPSQSSVSTDGVYRQVIHVYQGRSNSQDAAAFYRRNLDDYGWMPSGFDTGDPRATLQTYAKGQESLRIAITGDKAVTTITITISPQNAPAKEPAPTIIPPVTGQ